MAGYHMSDEQTGEKKKIDYKYEAWESSVDQVFSTSSRLLELCTYMFKENGYELINTALQDCETLKRGIERLKKLIGEKTSSMLLDNTNWAKKAIEDYAERKRRPDEVLIYLGIVQDAALLMSEGKDIEPVELEAKIFEKYEKVWKPQLEKLSQEGKAYIS